MPTGLYYTSYATVTNSNSIFLPEISAIAAIFEAGGSLTNTATGILGTPYGGVLFEGSAGSVVNFGVIDGEYYDYDQYYYAYFPGYNDGGFGVRLDQGGTVTNHAGGAIIGYQDGIISQGSAFISNNGAIVSDSGPNAVGVYYAGIELLDGGTVDSESIPNSETDANRADIGGGEFGILVENRSGTIINSGFIEGETAIGVELLDGGSITNIANPLGGPAYGGVIVGFSIGVLIAGAAGSVTNSGKIYPGVELDAGGSVTNQLGGLISSYIPGETDVTFIGVKITGGVGSIVNAGTITGTTASVEFDGTGANSLTLETGSVLNGEAVGSLASGASNALILDGEGSASNQFKNFDTLSVFATNLWTLGAFSIDGATTISTGILQIGDPSSISQLGGDVTLEEGAELEVKANSTLVLAKGLNRTSGNLDGALNVDAGAQVTLGGDAYAYDVVVSGAITLQGFGLFTDPITIATTGDISGSGIVSGALTNVGLISASGGLLDINGPMTGLGAIDIIGSAALKVDGAISAGQTVKFSAAGETLQIGDLADFHATISGFTAADQIAIAGLTSSDTLVFDPGDNSLSIYAGTTELGDLVFAGAVPLYALQLGTRIVGGVGAEVLDLTGGGSYAMGSDSLGVGTVDLLPSPPGQTGAPWTFTASALDDLSIRDSSGEDDTIILGAAGQFVLTFGAGTVDKVIADGAEAGALVQDLNHTPDTLEIIDAGSFVLNAADFNVIAELDEPSTLTLNGTFVGVDGSSGDDTVIVSAQVLNEATHIDLGEGVNTLVLEGGGAFHLSAAASMTGISSVVLQEGQAAYSSAGVDIASTEQTVYLRDGLNAVVTVDADAHPNAANPNAAGIIIYDADSADLIQLGPGSDTVFLESDAATVVGHGGNDIFYATAATSGSSILGGSGQTVLNLTGGGTVALGGNIVEVQSLELLAAPTGQSQPVWNVVAPPIEGMKITDFSNQADTIAFGAAGQSATDLGGGGDTFRFSAPSIGVDTINAFHSGLDHIGLSAAGFHITALSDVIFDMAAPPTAAASGQPTILYNTTTGALYYDASGGDGHIVQFAVLNGHPSLTLSDFLLA